MGGSVEIESGLGRGAAVTLYVPSEPSRAAAD
jgi:signal transduction histidine kinase